MERKPDHLRAMRHRLRLLQKDGRVAPSSLQLKEGRASLVIRKAGGYITGCVLDSKNGEVPVLFSESDITKAKLNASHAMAPAGPHAGMGGQHGPFRWLEREVVSQAQNEVALHAAVADDYPLLEEHYYLNSESFTKRTKLTNRSNKVLRTSLGEHLYWWLPAAEVNGLEVLFDGNNRKPFDRASTLQRVMAGEAQYWQPNILNDCRITFPDNRKFSLTAQTCIIQDEKVLAGPPPGMLFWHRKDTDSICLEPVVGIQSKKEEIAQPFAGLNNRGVVLMAGAAIILETHIQFIDAD